MSTWWTKTRRASSRHGRDARVYGHTTTAMQKLSALPPASLPYPNPAVALTRTRDSRAPLHRRGLLQRQMRATLEVAGIGPTVWFISALSNEDLPTILGTPFMRPNLLVAHHRCLRSSSSYMRRSTPRPKNRAGEKQKFCQMSESQGLGYTAKINPTIWGQGARTPRTCFGQ